MCLHLPTRNHKKLADLKSSSAPLTFQGKKRSSAALTLEEEDVLSAIDEISSSSARGPDGLTAIL